jgi:hypothetical protein
VLIIIRTSFKVIVISVINPFIIVVSSLPLIALLATVISFGLRIEYQIGTDGGGPSGPVLFLQLETL